MKIPKYLRKGVDSPGWLGAQTAARILEIEAAIWAKQGDRAQAHALRIAANAFKRIGPDTSPAKAFDWPDEKPQP